MQTQKRRSLFFRACSAMRRFFRLMFLGAEIPKKAVETAGLVTGITKIVAPLVPKVVAQTKALGTSLCSFMKASGLTTLCSPVCALQTANLYWAVFLGMVAGSFLLLYGLGALRMALRI